MPTIKYFNGRKTVLPGIYSSIKSGIKNPPTVGDFGKVLVIDTGSQAGFGGGSGISGELADGQDAVYQFTDLQAYREFLKGGVIWKCAEGLFKPDGEAIGASTVYHVKAATTEKSEMTFSTTANGGTFSISPKDEGIIGNGLLEGTNLYKGYAYTIESGVVDTGKFILKLWRGAWTGLHTDGIAWDGQTDKEEVAPVLLAESPEFDNMSTLETFFNEDGNFGEYFELNNVTVVDTGAVITGDVTGLDAFQVATGGTETYNAAGLVSALEAVKDLHYTHILSDKWGSSDYNGSEVGAILSHIQTDAKYDKYLFYGGGKDKTEFTQAGGSIAMAAYFDTRRVVVVHGEAKKSTNLTASGFRTFPTIYKAAKVLGRIVGFQPQVPGTFKSIGIEGEAHNLTDKEKTLALNGGVLATYFDADFNNFTILKAINTIQNNNNVVLPNGDSFVHQLERIKAQLNYDIVTNGKIQLLGQPNGVNRNTLSATIVKEWTEKFLQTKVASPSRDDLILDYFDVTVTRVQDYYEVTYGFIPNGEIDTVIFTGFIFD